MSNRSRRTTVEEVVVEPSFMENCVEKWSKGLRRGARWDKETFEDFPVCVHWVRQAIAVIVGVTVGFYGATGSKALLGGFAVVMALTFMYYSRFIEADEFSYSDSGLKMEGTMPSLALFLLAWTVTFTAMGHGSPPGFA